jgi:hypothetical protein
MLQLYSTHQPWLPVVDGQRAPLLLWPGTGYPTIFKTCLVVQVHLSFSSEQ